VGLIKLKTSAHKKEAISKMKRQPMDWEKIFADHIYDNG
jgi:hypothetical protein